MTKDQRHAVGEKLGLIGLGNMGSGLAKNLLKSGYSVIGFDIDKDKMGELTEHGLEAAPSTQEVAQNCQTVILCLPHPDATNQVIFNELLAAGGAVTTIIETSTLTPEIVRDVSKKLAERGIEFSSAPMIGGKNAAHQKTVHFLVEGPEDTYKNNEHILQAMGGRIDYMGQAPSATLAKLMFNLCRYANLAVGVEAYRLLQPYAPNMATIYDFMREQSLDNFGQIWGEDLKGTMTGGTQFKPSQVPKKDLGMLGDMAKKHALDSELIDAIRNTYISME